MAKPKPVVEETPVEPTLCTSCGLPFGRADIPDATQCGVCLPTTLPALEQTTAEEPDAEDETLPA